MFDRTKLLIGNENFKKIQNVNILVVGCGGVGGYICEFLVRSGVTNLTIVDFDKVDITNKNRQIIALNSTIGLSKVDVLEKRLVDINDKINLTAINQKFDIKLLETLKLEQFDYVIDAIDDVKNKALLISECKKRNVFVISAMGSGNRYDIPNFKVCDVFETYNDGLAKSLRKILKENNIFSHIVVFSESKPQKFDNVIGSIAYYPPACACVLVSYIINKILCE